MSINGRKKSVLRLFMALLFVFLFQAQSAFAALDVNVSPLVIDGEGKSREILRYSMTIKNNSKQLVSLYPWVRDVTSQGEVVAQENADSSSSLSSWLEFSRASLEMLPGDSVDLPLLVQINMHAKPGNYHAVIHLSNGSNRTEAELNKDETVTLTLNIKVLEDINERLQLNTFTPDKNFFSGDQVSFSYRLENIGNRGLAPSGKIRIYDRKGEEVADIDANKGNNKIEPDAKELIAAAWSSGSEFGRYKAMLDLQYGSHGTLQDTVFFWVLPWKNLLSLFLSLAVVCSVIALLVHSYISSGGKKLAYVTARFSSQEVAPEESSRVRNDRDFRTRIMRIFSWKKAHTLQEHQETASERVDIFRRNEPEAPLMLAREDAGYVGASRDNRGSVRLAPRQKQKVNPAHILNLKK